MLQSSIVPAVQLALASLVCAAGMAAVPVAGAQPVGQPAAFRADEPLPVDPRLTQGVLPNGMRYIVMQHAVPPGRAAAWLHVSTGSLNETQAQRGIAHFLEHMAFNGSKNFSPGSVIDFFQQLGLTFGRHQNASTRFDRTGYRLEMPDNKPETLGKALLFLSDVAFRLTLSPDEIEKERGVIMEEKRTRLGAQQRVQEAWIKQIAPGSIFGDRIPIGVEETILGVNQQDFKDYYGKWYVPSNMAIFVVADMDPAAMVEMIKKNFSEGQKKPPTPDLEIGIRPYTESRAVVISDPELTRTRISVIRVEPLRPAAITVGGLRAQLVEQLGVIAFNRRMEKKIARAEVNCLTAGLSAGNFTGALRLVGANASGEPSKWEAMLTDLCTELQRARLHGFEATEIEDAMREVTAPAEAAVQSEPTRNAVAIMAGWDESLGSGEPITSATQDLTLLKRLLPTIDAKEVSSTFAVATDTSAVTILVESPTGANMPAEAAVLAAAKAALAKSPAAEVAGARATALMKELPEAGAIVKTDLHAPSGVVNFELANGVTVHFRDMDYKKDQVSVSILLAGGELLESAANRGVGDAVVRVLGQPATSTLASTDIQDLLVGKTVRVGGNSQPDALMISVTGTPADLETGMQLAHLMLTDPKLEQAAFDHWRTSQLQAIEALKFSPAGVLTRQVFATIFPPGEVRVQPLTAEQVNALTIESCEAWLRKLITESPIEVTIVGDLRKERAQELATRYLGSLPKRAAISGGLYADKRKLVRPRGPIESSAEVKTKTPQAQVVAGFYGPDAENFADTRLMRAAAQILTSRMIREVREQEQLVYSISALSSPSRYFPGFGMFMARASTKPESAGRLGQKLQEMYTLFAKDGPTPDEVDVYKKQIANTMEESMREPGFWAGRLQSLAYHKGSLDEIMGDAAASQLLTAEQIKACFARYYSDQTRWTITIRPSP
ncbi:MAG: insulinase family protein [Planctomycetota bacterium]